MKKKNYKNKQNNIVNKECNNAALICKIKQTK